MTLAPKQNKKNRKLERVVMDELSKAWEFLYNFFFIGVIGYLARKWIAEKIMKLWVNKSERTIAIWQHYLARVQGESHQHDDVLDCHDNRCRVFTTYAN